jgi:hypothetical protein
MTANTEARRHYSNLPFLNLVTVSVGFDMASTYGTSPISGV